MQIPRPYLIKHFNEGCPNYHLKEFIMWANCPETAMSYSKELFNRRDFCPLQPTQFLTVAEATQEDQVRNVKMTFHGYQKITGPYGVK